MAFSARRDVRKISILLLVAAAVMMMTIAPAEARRRREVGEIKTFTWPWPFPSPSDPEIQKCWASLVNVQGCVQEIFMSFFTHNISLGPACCKSISQLNEYCAPKIFAWGPFNNVFLSLVKGYCASIGVGPLPLSPVQAPAPEPDQDMPPSPTGALLSLSDHRDLAPSLVEWAEPPQEQEIQPPNAAGPGDAESPNERSAPEPYESFGPSPIDGGTF